MVVVAAHPCRVAVGRVADDGLRVRGDRRAEVVVEPVEVQAFDLGGDPLDDVARQGQAVRVAAHEADRPAVRVGEDGVAMIAGARMKVAQLISEVMAYGWSPAELHFQHPHLTMSQIHSALAYYWDHLEEIEQQVDADLRYADKMRGARWELADNAPRTVPVGLGCVQGEVIN